MEMRFSEFSSQIQNTLIEQIIF